MEDSVDRIEAQAHDDALQGVRGLLQLAGRDPDTDDGVSETPYRVVDAFLERIKGYKEEPADILNTRFDVYYDEMIVLRQIEFQSTCEHHLLPFYGHASVGYIPVAGKVVGISKLARLVDCFALRLQIQERMTNDIADAIILHLAPKGVGVVVEAKHLCMVCRGVMKQDASMVTSVMYGALRGDPSARQEFLRIAGY